MHGQIIKLDSVLGAREGENKKITVSHCMLPPSLGHLVPVDVEMPQPRDPQELWRSHQSAKDAPLRSLPEPHVVIWEQQKFVLIFEPPSFSDSLAASSAAMRGRDGRGSFSGAQPPLGEHKPCSNNAGLFFGPDLAPLIPQGVQPGNTDSVQGCQQRKGNLLCLKPEASVHNKNPSAAARGALQRKE